VRSQTVAAAEQVLAASEDLARQADTLQHRVQTFLGELIAA
jgi:methyl-accepting chemotaxis protein